MAFLMASKFSRTLVLPLLLIAGVSGYYRWIAEGVLDNVSFSQVVRDREGEILRITLSGDEKYRLWTPLKDISSNYVEATLLMEDRYFYYHPGVNPVSLARSLTAYLYNKEIPPGASTITMQLARLRYGLKTRTAAGKIQQIFYALDLELRHSKKEILEAYLNLVPFGGPVEGVQAASVILFEKSAERLSASEALLFAIIPQNPNERRIDTQKGLELNAKMTKAFMRLKSLWLEQHPEDHIHLQDVVLKTIARGLKQLPFEAPHFTQLVSRASRATDIKTTLDLKVQKQIENKLAQYLQAHKKWGVFNASVLLTDSESGEVLSYIGSADFFNDQILGQNDGVQARRSPGSTLKPFVYALALQEGLIHPGSLLKDLPVQYAIYEPENFDEQYLGPLFATEALNLSRNVPAVFLSSRLKETTLYDFLRSAEIFYPRDSEYYGLSMVLGGTEVTVWELSQLYSALARYGLWKRNTWEFHQKSKEHRILSEESSFMALDMLKEARRPHETFQRSWTAQSTPIAWKTGTSHGFRDAWTAGVIGSYTLVVWFGNFDNTANHAFIGKDLAAPLFFQIADLLQNPNGAQPQWTRSSGLNLKKVETCASSGHLPGPYCKHKTAQWYQPGVSPIERCSVHRPVVVDTVTKKRVCGSSGESTTLEIYEFWSQDILKLYESAGIFRKSPPAFDSSCEAEASSGLAPEITSPAKDVVILKSQSSGEHLKNVSLSAVIDGDSSFVHWYLDNQFLRRTKGSETFTIVPPEGSHTITVVDEQGRTDSREIQVRSVQ